jgi:hypothetical protein
MAKKKQDPTQDSIYNDFLELDFDIQLELHKRQKEYLEDKATKKIQDGEKAAAALKHIIGKQ